MNIYKKTLRSMTALFGALSVMFCLGLASLAHATGLSEAVSSVNSISVADNGTFALGTPSNTGTSGQSLSDVLTITVTSNTKNGYKVTGVSSNGFLQHSGNGSTDAERISYKIGCDSIGDELGSTAGVTQSTITLTTSAQNILVHADPSSATNANVGNCDLSFATDESMEESFAGTYADTLTLAIAEDT